MAANRFSDATVRSFKGAAKKISKAAREFGPVFGSALRMFGEEIMTDVKAARPGHGVPVAKGTLRDSGDVQGPLGPEDYPFVELSFGGASAPYAMMQHEVTTYHHKIGEPRYLVRGLERWRPGKSGAYQLLKSKAAAALDQERKGG